MQFLKSPTALLQDMEWQSPYSAGFKERTLGLDAISGFSEVGRFKVIRSNTESYAESTQDSRHPAGGSVRRVAQRGASYSPHVVEKRCCRFHRALRDPCGICRKHISDLGRRCRGERIGKGTFSVCVHPKCNSRQVTKTYLPLVLAHPALEVSPAELGFSFDVRQHRPSDCSFASEFLECRGGHQRCQP
jgi:hypothetical protein